MSHDLDVAVLGGGIAGLATAYFLAQASPSLRVSVFERTRRTGGNIRSVERAGTFLDLGPDALVTQPALGVNMCEALGLGGELIAPQSDAAGAHVARGGRSRALPEGLAFGLPRGLGPLLETPLLSWGGKLRAGLDLVLPKRSFGSSLGLTVGHRLGEEAKSTLFEPMVHALYGTPSDQLDWRVVVPWLGTGSIVRQLVARPRMPADRLFRRPPRGLGQLVDALVARLPDGTVRLSEGVERMERLRGGGWSLSLRGGGVVSARRVVAALPPHALARVVEDSDLKTTLGEFRMRSVVSVLLAVDRGGTELPEGSGLLAHPDEPVSFLAASFLSRKWGLPASDEVFLRVVLLPRGKDESADESVARAVEELGRYVKLGALRWSSTRRYRRAMVIPDLDHVERVARARAHADDLGLLLAGAAFDGPGVTGALAGAERQAARALS